jgi:uncharacterized protein (DUF305 family)
MKAGTIVGSLLLISGIVCSTGASAQSSQASGVPQGLADGPYVHLVAMRYEEGALIAKAGATKAANADVKALASRILAQQQKAITELRQFMSSVAEDMAPANKNMLAKLPVEDLENASGAAFDRMFLDLMIQHHRDTLALTKGAKLSTQTVQDFAGRTAPRLTAELGELETLRKTVG